MRLAFAEIRRAKLRFGLLTGAVALLVFLILFQQSLAGSLLGRFAGGLEKNSASVLVYGAAARRSVDGSRVTPAQLEAVARVDGVAAAAPLGQASFTAAAAGSRAPVDATIFGFEPRAPGGPRELAEGRMPSAPNEAIADAADAADGFALGATVRVIPGDIELRVVGLAEGIAFNVQPTLFTTYETYGSLVRASNPSATGILPSLVAVRAADGVDHVALASRITREVDGVEALNRETAVDSLPGVDSIRQSFSIILGLAFVVVVLLTGFFFLIITVQKTTTLTLLRAVGASAAFLLRALVAQVVLVISLGSAIALGFAVVAVGGISDAALDASVDAGVAATTIATLLVLGLVATVASMRRIARLEPAAATQRLAGGGLA